MATQSSFPKRKQPQVSWDLRCVDEEPSHTHWVELRRNNATRHFVLSADMNCLRASVMVLLQPFSNFVTTIPSLSHFITPIIAFSTGSRVRGNPALCLRSATSAICSASVGLLLLLPQLLFSKLQRLPFTHLRLCCLSLTVPSPLAPGRCFAMFRILSSLDSLRRFVLHEVIRRVRGAHDHCFHERLISSCPSF